MINSFSRKFSKIAEGVQMTIRLAQKSQPDFFLSRALWTGGLSKQKYYSRQYELKQRLLHKPDQELLRAIFGAVIFIQADIFPHELLKFFGAFSIVKVKEN